jgi:tRNA pseudouridine32 synthase/23S rRNA pseudouridine746 synthase
MPGRDPEIVFESDSFWVIDKPEGWTVQKDEKAPGVLEWLQTTFNCKAYPSHRIDKPTTGLLLVAKTVEANRILSQAFEAREITKTYIAISDQKPKKKQGWVKGDMAPSRRGQYKLLRTSERPAITQFNSQALEGGLRGFIIKPKTGKTHQLRVALKSLGSPILGDTLYAGTPAERVYLHAWQLEFQFEGQAFQFTADPDEQWKKLWPITVAE